MLRVLHVVPRDLARGSQVYARALVDSANRQPAEHHEIVALFAAPRVAALPDHELGATSGRLHAAGLDPTAAWRLWSLIRRSRPDVVVAHGAESLKYSLALRLGRTPVVCLAIGVTAPDALSGPRRVMYRGLYRGTSLMIAVSESVAAELREVFKVPANRVRVIPNGRDPAQFRPALEPGVGAPRLLFVGHLTGTKRPHVFLDVVARLRARGCNFRAQIVGDGPLELEVKGRANDLAVEMLGRRDDVSAVLRGAGLLLFTSKAQGEGMPGVLIEAGLAGVPVVATEVPGARDVVLDRVTGRVLPVDDVEGITDAVEELLPDPIRRHAMGAAARARCVKLFSLEATTMAWRTILRDVSSRR